MAHIVGEYKLTLIIDGKSHILKDKMRLEELHNYNGTNYIIKFCIKGKPKLLKFIKSCDSNIHYLSQNRWGLTEYTMLNQGFARNNNLFHIIYKIISLKNEKDNFYDFRFNYLTQLIRTMSSIISSMKNIVNWSDRMKKVEMNLLKYDEKTYEMKKVGLVILEVNLDKKKLLASAI